MKIFLANRKRASSTEIEAACAKIRELSKSAGHPIEIITARDRYLDPAKGARMMGSISGWIQMLLADSFDAIVVPEETVGTITFDIITRALALGRPVFLLSERKYDRVVGIRELDPESYKERGELQVNTEGSF